MINYEELRDNGIFLDCGASLHCWHEDYHYSGKVYRVSGALGHPDVTIEEICNDNV